jgi:hypothetical protein
MSAWHLCWLGLQRENGSFRPLRYHLKQKLRLLSGEAQVGEVIKDEKV